MGETPTDEQDIVDAIGGANWQTGDTLIAAGNVRYRVVSVIPEELVAEFILDERLAGVIEVERI